MRLLFVAALAALLPFNAALAQGTTETPQAAPVAGNDGGSIVPVVAIAAGVVATAVVADIVTSGALSGPLLRAAGWETAAARPAVGGLGGLAAPATAPAAAPTVAIVTPAATVAAPPLVRPWWRFW